MICAFTIIPIAYYAISLRQHPEIGFAEFWWKTITVGPWPSGPVWFLWVLLGFDLVASLLYRLSPNLLDPINRLSLRGHDRPADFFAVMFAVTAALYIPGRILLRTQAAGSSSGRSRSSTAACCSMPAYFFFGAGIGAANFGSRAAGGGRPAGEEQLGLDDPDARSVLPACGC